MHAKFLLLVYALTGLGFAATAAMDWLRRGRPAGWWREWLTAPRLLYGGAGCERRLALAEPLYLAALAVFLVNHIMVLFMGDVVPGAFFPLTSNLSMALLLVKGLLCTRYSLRDGVCAFVLLTLVAIGLSGYYVGNVMDACLYVIFAKDVSLKKIIKVHMAFVAAMVVVIAGLAIVGVLPIINPGYNRNGVPRLTLGFIHPNNLCGFVFALFVGLAILLFKKHPLLLIPPWAAAFYLAWWPCSSRTPAIAFVAFGVLLLVLRFLPKLFDAAPVKALITASPVLAAAFSYAVALSFRAGVPLWDKLNDILSTRLFLWHTTVAAVPPQLRAMDLVALMNSLGICPAMDNYFIYISYHGGLILLAVILAGYSLLLYRLLAAKKPLLVTVVLSFLVYGLSEMAPEYLWFNLAFFLFTPLLYGQSFEELDI